LKTCNDGCGWRLGGQHKECYAQCANDLSRCTHKKLKADIWLHCNALEKKCKRDCGWRLGEQRRHCSTQCENNSYNCKHY
jgi:hypothetical protein